MSTGNKISKAELLNNIVDKTGKSKKDVKLISDALIDEIIVALKNGDVVTIQGLGRFQTKLAKGRSFRKINTDEILQVGPRTLPKCKFSKKLIEDIAG